QQGQSGSTQKRPFKELSSVTVDRLHRLLCPYAQFSTRTIIQCRSASMPDIEFSPPRAQLQGSFSTTAALQADR
ncbi:MAG: hypothetical protein EBX64_03605, partial [Betaproteobacteria bacterium]|nr:hypothetical protein [Betaproteobacteria bacterium]